MKDDARFSTMEEGPVEAALADYFDRLDRGEHVELADIIAAHPGCEVGLRQFFQQERKVHNVVAASALVAPPHEDASGRTLGDFRLLRAIGQGGMGVVWEAEQISLGRKVAVKLLPSSFCSDPRHRSRFQNEARILAQLEHPNIVHVIAVGEESNTYYFAMQLVDGITADDLIRAWGNDAPVGDARTSIGGTANNKLEDDPDRRAPLPFPSECASWIAASQQGPERYLTCARIAAGVAAGLAHAHECGVLHRDVKPSNILLDKAGAARLTDFGLARMFGDATMTLTGTVLGTLRYASPEQLRGTAAGVDERSDVYSLGVTLWELVTGKRLFDVEDQHTVVGRVLSVEPPRPSLYDARVPRDLETVIARAVAKEPGDRYVSAQAFADDLRRFLAGRPVLAKPLSRLERTFRWANRNRVLASSAIGLLMVLATAALLANALILRANSRTATALQASQSNEEKARQNEEVAEASERKTRELLYAADMALAGAAWQKNEPAHVRMILDRYATPKPRGNGLAADDPRGFEWYFLDRQVRPQSELLFQNDKALYVIQFVDDGKQFLTAGLDSIVRWHESSTGKAMRSLNTQQGEVNGVSYNPSGTIFATAGDDGTVKIWNAADHALLHSIAAHDNKCFVAKFLNDELILTAARNRIHRLFSAADGKLIREYASPDARKGKFTWHNAIDLQISQSGEQFWTTEDNDGKYFYGVYEWDVATGKSRRISEDRVLCHVLIDRSQKFLFLNTERGLIRILDRRSGSELHAIQLADRIESLALSPDESLLVVGDLNGQLSVWNLDLANASEIVSSPAPNTFPIHQGDMYGTVFAPDGKSVISVGRDGAVRRTRLEAPREPFHEIAGLKDKQCVPLPETDLALVYGSTPLELQVRETGRSTASFAKTHFPLATVSPDGKFVGAARSQDMVIFNAAKGKLVRKLKADQMQGRPVRLEFSTDNSWIAVGNRGDGAIERIEVVEIATGKIEQYSAPGTISRWFHFCADSGLMGYLTTPGQLVCWNVPDKTIRWKTEPLEARYAKGAVSPDGKVLLTAEQRILNLIDCITGEVRYRLPCEHPVATMAFTRDGRSFVVGGTEGQLSVWNTQTGQRLFGIANLQTAIESIKPLDNGFLASTRQIKEGRSELNWYEF